MGDSGYGSDTSEYRDYSADYKKHGFSHFRRDDVTNHEGNLINITTNFYNITSFNDVGTDAFTQIINEITECKNFRPHPAKESRLSDKARKLQAKFNEYFEKYPSINHNNEHKTKLLEKVERFFKEKKSKKEMDEARRYAQERRENDAVSGLLMLSKGEGKRKSGYKRKTSKKHRKRHSSRKKHRKHRTRRH